MWDTHAKERRWVRQISVKRRIFSISGKDGKKKPAVVSDEEDNHLSTLPPSFLNARRTFPGPSSSFSIFHLIKPPPPSLHFPLPDLTRGRRTPLPKVFLSSIRPWPSAGRSFRQKSFPFGRSPPLPPPPLSSPAAAAISHNQCCAAFWPSTFFAAAFASFFYPAQNVSASM